LRALNEDAMRRITFITTVLDYPLRRRKGLVSQFTIVSNSVSCAPSTIWSQDALPFFPYACSVSPPLSSPPSKASVIVIFVVAFKTDEFINQVDVVRLLDLLAYLLVRKMVIQTQEVQLTLKPENP
jgi:hypothetical protein